MDDFDLQVSAAFDGGYAIRILGILHTRLLNEANFLASIRDITEPLVAKWKDSQLTQLLAVDVYPQHTFFVLDVNNKTYDYHTAHETAIYTTATIKIRFPFWKTTFLMGPYMYLIADTSLRRPRKIIRQGVETGLFLMYNNTAMKRWGRDEHHMFFRIQNRSSPTTVLFNL
ncbi:hypothetical protein EYZ11_013349 [Aspergillus tanneri]|uniref:Uncharacterized protein n=1 Tax=Aspergillus tanneri TaxID=1220188 RepID=A0A4S3IY49_9EURO|nr:hypothetical protein EYZ11_013349 [Aspergillus tanneri]